MSTIKLSDYIAKRLKEHNVEHFFIVSGGGAMHLNDSLGRVISYTANHHEQACAIAAEGYARINQKLAVVNVTTGPGGLNCLNGVFGQWTDSVPVLYISGQVKTSTCKEYCKNLNLRQLGDQEVDIISVVKPLTKYAQRVTEPNKIKYYIDKAIYEATNGRFGPVWLDIPINIQAAIIEEDELLEFIPPQKEEYKFDINEVINKLKTAKRPLIVVGNGIHCSKQENNFYDFIEGLNIPVATSFNGVDLIYSEHKNFCGRIGTVGQRAGNFNLQNADVILFLGTRNNIRQVSYNWENFAKNAFKIVVDIDKSELEKPLVKPNLAINCDLREFLSSLSEYKSELLSNKNTEWLDFCKKLVRKYSFEYTKEYQSKDNVINVYDFVHTLSKVMQERDVLITANGSACVCTHQVFDIKKNQRVFWNSGDASMGYSLPASIGACLANNKKRTICLEGDGSIMMNLQELQTVVHYNLPIKIFVINNNGYISIKQTQNNFFQGNLTGCSKDSGVSMPNFTKISEAFGLKTFTIKNPENILSLISSALEYDGPVLCNVIVETDYTFTPKLLSQQLEDGTIVSPSFENMYPFLSKQELSECLYK